MAYRQAQHLHRYQIPPPNRDAVQLSTAAYYNNVYKGAAVRTLVMDPCQTVQQIADHASPAGQSSGKGAAGGAEPLAATAAALFGLSPDS